MTRTAPRWLDHLPAAMLTLGVGLLSWMSRWMTLDVTPWARTEKCLFIGLALALFAVYALSVWAIVRKRLRLGLWPILAWAAVMRLLLLPSVPIQETDQCRYLWDGVVLAHGLNPYKFAPAEIRSYETEPLRFAPGLWDELDSLNALRKSSPAISENFERINNAAVPTIYFPFAQMTFAIAAFLGPGSLLAWRLVVLLLDACLIRLLLLCLARFDLPRDRIAIYAWSPLVLKEYINTAHFDVLMMALLTGAFLLLLPRRGRLGAISPSGHHLLLAGVALGAAVATKLMPLILLPIWLRQLGWKGLSAALLTMVLLTLPFSGVTGATGPSGMEGLEDRGPGFAAGKAMFTGLVTFGHHWEFNSSLVSLFEEGLEHCGVPGYGKPEARTLFHLRGWGFRLDAFLLAKLLAASLFGAIWLGIVGWAWKQTRPGEKNAAPTVSPKSSSRSEDAKRSNIAATTCALTEETFERSSRLCAATLGTIGVMLLCSPVANPWYVGWLVPWLVLTPRGPWLLLTGVTFLNYHYFLDGGYIDWVRWVEYLPVYLWLAWMAWSRLRSGRGPVST